MSEYVHGLCPKYAVDIRNNGMADFTILVNNDINSYSIDLKKENLWESYSSPNPKRHFICHEDGELIVTPYNYNRLILPVLGKNNEQSKIFYRVRQWEFDWWMNLHFPESANGIVHRKIKEYINY